MGKQEQFNKLIGTIKKAKHLLEGGQELIGGLRVEMVKIEYTPNPCLECELDYICQVGTELCEVCLEMDLLDHNLSHILRLCSKKL